MGGIHSKATRVIDPFGIDRKAISKVSGVDDGGHGDPLLLSNEAKKYSEAKEADKNRPKKNYWTGLSIPGANRDTASQYKAKTVF